MILGELEVKGLDGEVRDCPLCSKAVAMLRCVVALASVERLEREREVDVSHPNRLSSEYEHAPDTSVLALSSAPRRPQGDSGSW